MNDLSMMTEILIFKIFNSLTVPSYCHKENQPLPPLTKTYEVQYTHAVKSAAAVAALVASVFRVAPQTAPL